MDHQGLSDSAGRLIYAPEAPAAKPDYVGHRSRLRQRFLKEPAALPDYEVLEMLLAMAQPRGDTKPAAKALLRAFNDSLADVLSADPTALMEVDGLGETSVVALKVVREAALRLMNPKGKDMTAISSWTALLGYLTARDAYADTEQFRIVFLDRKNKIISDEAQQKGTVDHTPVYPREVVKRALELNASAIIMVHNHPSGDPTPSRADIEMTRKVKDAAGAVNIVLHDHVIVSRGGHVSFRSAGLI